MTLKIEHLTGGYTGVPVIKDINLEIKPGEALGLIGLNGAGKSTTIKHILGYFARKRVRSAWTMLYWRDNQLSLSVK